MARSRGSRRHRTSGSRRLPFLPVLPGAGTTAHRRPASRRTPGGRWLRARWSGPAGSRSYEVYLPAGHRRTARLPMVLLLHGCRQSAREFATATRFTSVADRHGFLLVAPSQSRTAHPGGCWRWYEPAHQARGTGEPAVLAGITAAVSAEPFRWRIDSARVYVAGLSAGAAMALVLGVSYPDVFAAVGVHAGPPYRAAASAGQALAAMHGRADAGPAAGPMPPLIVVQGVADPVVHVRAGERVVEQWLASDAAGGASNGQPVVRSRSVARRSADGRTYSVARWYTPRGRKRLEFWRIDGLGHAWSGGAPDLPYSDPRGPRAGTAMWSFFSGQAR